MLGMLLWPLLLGFSLGNGPQTPSMYDEGESMEESHGTLPAVPGCEEGSPAFQPRGFPGQFCGNDSDSLELSARSRALLLGWGSTRLVPALYGLAVVVGLPANGLALWVLATRVPRLPATVLLMNLAVADLLLVLALPPRLLYHAHGQRWTFGEAACRASTAALYGHLYGSGLLLAAISVDRYLALVHPLRARAVRGRRLTAGLCVAAWLTAAALAAPLTAQRQTYRLRGSDRVLCHDALPLAAQLAFWRPAFACLALLGGGGPLLVVLLGCALTLHALAAAGARYGHARRLTALVLAAALLFFAPSNALLLLHYLRPAPDAWGDLYAAYAPCLALSTLNSCLDPFVYYYGSPEFRDKVRAVLARRPPPASAPAAASAPEAPHTRSSLL
ncbi:proteinase-activated receptor 4 [Thomomys bottae]